MADLVFWTSQVKGFRYSYISEDDVFVLCPMDDDGEEIDEEIGLVVEANMLGDFLSKIQWDYKAIMDIRRTLRKGRKKGVSEEVIKERYNGQAIADDLDHYYKRQLG
jgi:hypothetical protein